MVPAMRFSLALILSVAGLAVAAPALAADSTVGVGDDFYDPSATTSVNPGDTVNWDWASDSSSDHTVTSNRRQIDRFNSGIKSGSSASFSHTFKYPGRFRYFCEIHPDSMRSTVTVGTDDNVAPTLSRARVRVSRKTAKFSFKLSERSVVTVKAGTKKASKTFGAGKHAIRIKHLKAKRYKGVFSAKDGFGNKSKTVRKRFRVR
jgi:plastocyanin